MQPFINKANSSRQVLQSQNRLGWKRTLRSLSPTFNSALPSPPLNHVPKRHIDMSVKHLQQKRLNLGSLFQAVSTLSVKKLFLIFKLNLLDSLLTRVQRAVDQHLQVLFCQTAFQPLLPQPAAFHGVVTQVQNSALHLFEPQTTGLSPFIQPVQSALCNLLPTANQHSSPTWSEHE